MSKPNASPYAKPFDIMVGAWTGHSILYDKNGNYMHTGPSLVAISWKSPTLMHYKQWDLGDLDALAEKDGHAATLKHIIMLREFDLTIDGKRCDSTPETSETVQVEGSESSPGTYLFHLKFAPGSYYNNQFFNNPNERHIIGPYVPNGQSEFSYVVSQTFSRISYDVPEGFMETQG